MDLHLNLKKCYFDAIKSGDKEEEYREYNDYWIKRLVGRKYSRVVFKCGYPAKLDGAKHITRIYRGYDIKEIYHEHFDALKKVKVFAIKVSKN